MQDEKQMDRVRFIGSSIVHEVREFREFSVLMNCGIEKQRSSVLGDRQNHYEPCWKCVDMRGRK